MGTSQKKKQSGRTLRLILGDQLNTQHSWFSKPDSSFEYVMMEVHSEATYVTHHIQKLVAFFLSMRAFRDELAERGFSVTYIELDAPHNAHSLEENLAQLISERGYEAFEYQAPDEVRVAELLARFSRSISIPATVVSSEHFLVEPEFFKGVFRDHKRYVMETFYRAVRARFNLLMEGDKPLGGRWNYDNENRNKLPSSVQPPAPLLFPRNVEALVNTIKSCKIPYIGNVDPKNFTWPTTRAEALRSLEYFCEHLLPSFGTYQDAMHTDQRFLFHSRLSFSLNVKHLSALEVAQAAIDTYLKAPKTVTLPQVEGFVRQIVGWREFMRGIYWTHMPEYKSLNVLQAKRPLPHYYWDGDTKMNCVRHAVQQSLEEGYAHHIQRLMVTGNFAILAGIDPDHVDAWYLGIYIDALEWVQLPNTRGMSQFADGGIVGTKPYTSSAAYINKMSNYCSGCHYKYKERLGERACPFNSLYWDFLLRNSTVLSKNPRIGMGYQLLAKMPPEEKQQIKQQASSVLERIEEL
jgi:deoxyribodipyrimidine photolyase-related protein